MGMTTGATIHTTAGLNMTVTHRLKPPVIPVMGETSLTTIDENGSIKSYTPSNGTATLYTSQKENQELTA